MNSQKQCSSGDFQDTVLCDAGNHRSASVSQGEVLLVVGYCVFLSSPPDAQTEDVEVNRMEKYL